MKFSFRTTHALPTLLILATAASSAVAHPGHPIKGSGVAHIVASPYHHATLAGGGLLLLGAAWFIKQRTPRRALQYAGVSALASAAVLWGVSL